jgi:hypothetical protein
MTIFGIPRLSLSPHVFNGEHSGMTGVVISELILRLQMDGHCDPAIKTGFPQTYASPISSRRKYE